jgi:hypothetical protein
MYPATLVAPFPTIRSTASILINQSTNQPINQSTNQPINQSTNQPINQSTNQPINQSTNNQPQTTRVELSRQRQEWDRFIGVAAQRAGVIENVLPHLKKASLVWGREKVQHYRWHDRGFSFCKKLGAVADERPWPEFVTKANRLLWRRATMERKYRRRHIKNLADPLGEIELCCLKFWLGEHSYIEDKDPDQTELQPSALSPEELPDGFGFDKFGLLVRNQYALSTAKHGTNPPEISPNPFTPLNPEHVESSPRSVEQDETMISPASEAASEVPSRDFIAFDFTATRLTEFASSTENTIAVGLITPEPGSPDFPDADPFPEENNVQRADDAHNANDETVALDDDLSRPKVRALRRKKGRIFGSTPNASCHPKSAPKETSAPVETANLKRCCPHTISPELLQILDLTTLDGAATPRVLANHVWNGGNVIARELCVKHLRKFAEALLTSEQDSREISPTATCLRRCRTSLPDIDGHSAYRRIRLDEHSYSQRPSTITISQQSRPVYDQAADKAFWEQTLRELETKQGQAVQGSRGKRNDDLVYNILLESTPPVTDESCTIEAHFWSGDEAAVGVETQPPEVPVFTQGQQRFRWREGRPIRQLFHRIVDFDQRVAVNIPSLGTHTHTHNLLRPAGLTR